MRKVVAAIGTLLLGALIYGYTLPSTWHVERSIVISTTPSSVFAWIGSLSQWPRWAMPEGLSAQITDKTLEWTGGARIDVTEVVPDQSISYELRYSPKDRPVLGKLKVTGQQDHTVVTWTDDGDMGHNPLQRYFVSRIQRDVGRDMEQGLQRLKNRIERN